MAQAANADARAGGPAIEITCFTDPYCTWCWGSEPILRHLQESYGDQLRIHYVMGGLVRDMSDFFDPLNRISTAAQVAPHWQEASARHGMPVDTSIFLDSDEPFVSTWPANIAYKAAQMQGREPAGRFLRRMREAAASEGVQLSRPEVLGRLAAEAGLDRSRFERDLGSAEAEAAFHADLAVAREQHVSGFPTYLIRAGGGETMLHGFHSYARFIEAIERLAGKLTRREPDAGEPDAIPAFVSKYGHVATQEVAEVFSLTRREALERLGQLELQGRLRKVPRGNGEFWERAV